MAFDVFISYSWAQESTRTFVRDLASHLRLAGFDVGFDLNVDYGESLAAFMESIVAARHVLMVIDCSYLERSETNPESGVSIESAFIREAIDTKPGNWLSVAFVDQRRLPDWLSERNPKGFFFGLSDRGKCWDDQLEDLWRWLEGLPAGGSDANSLRALRKRAERLEEADLKRERSVCVSPELEGVVKFYFEKARPKRATLGFGVYRFDLSCSRMTFRSVYLYADYVHSIGLVPDDKSYKRITSEEAASCLSPGRTVRLFEGGQFVLLNKEGVLLVGLAKAISCPDDPFEEVNSFLEFEYRVIFEE